MIICFLDTWSTSTFLSHISFLFSFPESRKVVGHRKKAKNSDNKQFQKRSKVTQRINQGKGRIVQLHLLLLLKLHAVVEAGKRRNFSIVLPEEKKNPEHTRLRDRKKDTIIAFEEQDKTK
mmetsp:Transcript_61273/g.149988  ORF Transcript_61273/g.149988 Transcript_61273/m.149988 type:complete len:120 (+) Transcript_61273:64-423(+)